MLRKAKSLLSRLHRDDTGAMAVEKVLLIALIALPLIVGLAIFRDKIIGYFNTQDKKLEDGSTATPMGG